VGWVAAARHAARARALVRAPWPWLGRGGAPERRCRIASGARGKMALQLLLAALLPCSGILDIPPRYMWGWSPPAPADASGYCGSMSLQMAGIYYGSYMSQDAIRGMSGGHNAKHALLIGVGGGEAERTVCRALRLNCSAWNFNKAPNPQASAFMRWASAAIDEGKPVIMGLYWAEERDQDYDHIVPMVGYDGDAIYYNDLYSNATRRANKSAFVSTRKHCKKSANSGLVSAVSERSWRFCLPEKVDYGLIVHGNLHAEQAGLYPVRLSMGTWSEPDYSKEDKLHESPRQLSATVTISGLTAGAHYALLWYDTPNKIPARDLLGKGGYTGMLRFTAPPPPSPPSSSAEGATSFQHSVTFASNSTTMFRCVAVPSTLMRSKTDDSIVTKISPSWSGPVLSTARAVPTHQDAISNAFDPSSPLSKPAYARMAELGAQNVPSSFFRVMRSVCVGTMLQSGFAEIYHNFDLYSRTK
jgi:hypothetical protein